MNRREAIALIPAASLMAQPSLDKAKFANLEQLCDLLIPSEHNSPGAREARVAWYIDTVLKYADTTTKTRWAEGLGNLTSATIDRESKDESSFFNTTFKPLAIEAFCLSKEARQALGYAGDRAIDAFPGCNHPEH